MSEKVLSTKVPKEDVETIKSIAEEKGRTVSSLLRELIDSEIKKKKVDWNSPCFGKEPRDDQPKKKDAKIDEIVYGK
ncbi:MAG: ribbon-helix-helix protein, CopG family [Candidatus Saliniplasma sp.]